MRIVLVAAVMGCLMSAAAAEPRDADCVVKATLELPRGLSSSVVGSRAGALPADVAGQRLPGVTYRQVELDLRVGDTTTTRRFYCAIKPGTPVIAIAAP